MSSKPVCNWCDRHVALLAGKPFCKDCDMKCFRECCRCHRPFNHPKYFQLDPLKQRCDACQRKLLQERTRLNMKKSKQIIESDTDSLPSDTGSEEVEKKIVKDPAPIKKVPMKRTSRVQTTTPKKKKACDQAEALKALVCQWSQEEDCMKRILDGKKMALVPIFF